MLIVMCGLLDNDIILEKLFPLDIISLLCRCRFYSFVVTLSTHFIGTATNLRGEGSLSVFISETVWIILPQLAF